MKNKISEKKLIILVLVLISILYFLIFIIPNKTGAENIEMVSIFEPDEFAQYPHLIRMVELHGNTLRQKLWHFVSYQHYYYGFPFYAFSSIWLFIVKILSGIENTQLNFLILRQFVSVLPIIISTWILVYLQTKFERIWKTLLLFLFLLSLPIVIKNNMWWHPDSLAILFSVLVIYFLVKDDFNFDRYFYLSAVSVGLSIGTKMLGWFFFLTIPIYLIWGLSDKKINHKVLIRKSIIFLILMFVTILISNPALIHPVERARYITIQKAQSAAMSFGWQVAYEKGPASWVPIISDYYGRWYFLIIVFIGLIIGIIRKETRLLNVLILSWVVPMLIYILFFVAIKPKHLLLPIALPLFSCCINLFPGKELSEKTKSYNLSSTIGFLVLIIQFGLNLKWDYRQFNVYLDRENNNPAILFYEKLDSKVFSCFPEDISLKVYRDVRAYVPERENLVIVISWQPINYPYILDENPDIIIIPQQKISDYTRANILATAQDAGEMRLVYDFYSDVKAKHVLNYQPVVEDDFGTAFIRQDLVEWFDCRE